MPRNQQDWTIVQPRHRKSDKAVSTSKKINQPKKVFQTSKKYSNKEKNETDELFWSINDRNPIAIKALILKKKLNPNVQIFEKDLNVNSVKNFKNKVINTITPIIFAMQDLNPDPETICTLLELGANFQNIHIVNNERNQATLTEAMHFARQKSLFKPINTLNTLEEFKQYFDETNSSIKADIMGQD